MNLTGILSGLMTYGPMVVTAAAAAAAVLPKGGENSVWATIRAIIDVLAVNFGNAKNSPK